MIRSRASLQTVSKAGRGTPGCPRSARPVRRETPISPRAVVETGADGQEVGLASSARPGWLACFSPLLKCL